MLKHLHSIWTVAEREVLAVVHTKGFWFISVLGPIFVGLPLYMIWLVLLPLAGDTVSDMDIEMSEIFEDIYEDEIGAVRNFLWGDPLRYSVVDLTGQMTESIRQEIFERDKVHLLHGLRISIPLSISIEGLKESVENDPASYTFVPNLSTHRFQAIEESNVSFETLNNWLGTGQIAGYFILPKNFLSSNEGAQFVRPNKLSRARARKLDDLKLWFEDIATSVRQKAILSREIIDEDLQEVQINSLMIDIRRVVPVHEPSSSPTEIHESARSSRSPLANWVKLATIPYAYFFFMVMVSATNLVVTNTIEEKSSKVAELLVANSSPSQILDGKLFGSIVVVLLPIVAFCAIIGPPIVAILGTIVGYDSTVFTTLLHPVKIFTWFLFLILGFMFFGYIQGALGSMCNDLKEIMLTLYPVQFVITFGVLPAVIFVMVTPDGKLAQVLSFIPFLTPSVMVSRSASLPEWPIYLLILLVMGVSILIVRKFSTTLFAHGMLSEGAPQGLGKILKLARRPV